MLISILLVLALLIIFVPMTVSLVYYHLHKKSYPPELTAWKFWQISAPTYRSNFSSRERYGIDFRGIDRIQAFTFFVIIALGIVIYFYYKLH